MKTPAGERIGHEIVVVGNDKIAWHNRVGEMHTYYFTCALRGVDTVVTYQLCMISLSGSFLSMLVGSYTTHVFWLVRSFTYCLAVSKRFSCTITPYPLCEEAMSRFDRYCGYEDGGGESSRIAGDKWWWGRWNGVKRVYDMHDEDEEGFSCSNSEFSKCSWKALLV